MHFQLGRLKMEDNQNPILALLPSLREEYESSSLSKEICFEDWLHMKKFTYAQVEQYLAALDYMDE